MSIEPQIKLVDARLQLAITALSLDCRATRSGAGAVIFHNEVVFEGGNVDFGPRLHYVLYLWGYSEGNRIGKGAGTASFRVDYRMSNICARRGVIPPPIPCHVVEDKGPAGGDFLCFFGLRDRKSTRLNSSHSQISYA